jgi:hypothetical protein
MDNNKRKELWDEFIRLEYDFKNIKNIIQNECVYTEKMIKEFKKIVMNFNIKYRNIYRQIVTFIKENKNETNIN